eukprot:scaffold2697_cov346-Pavlova_lutheri.AAC.23
MGGGRILEENEAKNDGHANEKLEPMHVSKGSDGADVLHAKRAKKELQSPRTKRVYHLRPTIKGGSNHPRIAYAIHMRPRASTYALWYSCEWSVCERGRSHVLKAYGWTSSMTNTRAITLGARVGPCFRKRKSIQGKQR